MPDERLNDKKGYEMKSNKHNSIAVSRSLRIDPNTVPDNVLEDSSSQSNSPNTPFQPLGDYSSQEESSKESHEHIIRLIKLIKQYPIIFDSNYQSTLPKATGKRQLTEAWQRIGAELPWHTDKIWNSEKGVYVGTDGGEVVWNDLIANYSKYKRKQPSAPMSNTIIKLLSFMDPFIGTMINAEIKEEKPGGRHLIQNNMEHKDTFFNEMPQNITEDVMISGRQIVSHSTNGYVVLQPQRTRPQINVSSSAPSQTTTTQQPTQATIRTYPLPAQQQQQPPRRIVFQLSGGQSTHLQYDNSGVKHKGNILQVVKEEVPDDNTTTTQCFTGTSMMVDMSTSYQNGQGQKMYKLMVPSTQQQASMRNVHPVRNTSQNIEYDLPPEPLIESPDSPQDGPPPRKKLAMHSNNPSQIRTTSMTSTASTSSMKSTNRVEVLDGTIVAGGVPISADEIIEDGIQESTIVIDEDGHLHEESPLLSAGPDVMISGQSGSSAHDNDEGLEHHQDMSHDANAKSRKNRFDFNRMNPNIFAGGREPTPEDDDQVNEDLRFQQLISSHLSRASEDEKALLKFHMQRILLDARFGEGTVKNMIHTEVIIDEQVHIDGEMANEEEEEEEEEEGGMA